MGDYSRIAPSKAETTLGTNMQLDRIADALDGILACLREKDAPKSASVELLEEVRDRLMEASHALKTQPAPWIEWTTGVDELIGRLSRKIAEKPGAVASGTPMHSGFSHLRYRGR